MESGHQAIYWHQTKKAKHEDVYKYKQNLSDHVIC